MSEEKKLILEMVKEGKIDTAQAEKLLAETESGEEQAAVAAAPKPRNRKFLRVLVTEGDKTKVNINIPIALAEVGLKMIPRDKLIIEGREISPDDLMKMIREANQGEMVNIDAEDKGKKVKIKAYID
ncbi:MAG TPA: hypothetical protein VKS21_00020 [Spirochaetota bacterium]|nr:hypothetical protein [Spirochaetota bacterium]